ncbi:MAG: MFS transporter [Rhizobiales bacterium]|nr:MFS transporter [Hyphomicrobiales bacterium]
MSAVEDVILPDIENAALRKRLTLYLGGQASWFVSLGIQFVLFPYLVANVLEESAAKVGIAQMSLMVPSLLFMLLGGATADQSDVRRILIRVHILAAIPPLLLAIVFIFGDLSYSALIIYALAMGTLGAFAMPARDSALTRVAGNNIQKTVAMAMGTQMGSQLVGMLVAALAATTGTPALLIVQMIVMLGGGYASWKLAPLPPTNLATKDSRLKQILDGIAIARASPVVFTVIGMMFAVGLFYVGSFLVILPLMARDIFGGSVWELSLINICFWGGTIVSNMALIRVGHIHHRGRVMMGSLTSGLIILFLMSFPIPFVVLCLYCFVWGLGAGTTMTMGRTIVQIAAPETHRARVLALYQLGFSGGAPVGALMMGLLVGQLGIYHALWVPTVLMLIILISLRMFSPIWAYHEKAA